MDTTLVTVTLLSMAMAATLSVIVWRMLRDERRRSEARVLALTAAAARPSSAAPRTSQVAPRTVHREPRTSDLDLAIRETAAPETAMFVEHDVASPWGHRFAVMGGLGLAGGESDVQQSELPAQVGRGVRQQQARLSYGCPCGRRSMRARSSTRCSNRAACSR